MPNEVQCRTCTIAVSDGVTLGTRDGAAALPGAPTNVIVDGVGRFWLTFSTAPPLVFASNGTFIRQVGRTGEGPGEYRNPNVAFAAGADSVVVIDNMLFRATVLDSEMRPARSLPLPGPIMHAVVVRWPDRIIVNSDIRSPQHLGFPLHLISMAGSHAEIDASFAADEGEISPTTMGRIFVPLSPAERESVWAADATRFRLNLFSVDGTLQTTLTRHPTWFPAESPWGIGNPRTPPPPIVASLKAEHSARLWTFIRVPARNWADAWPDIPSGVSEITGSMLPTRDALYETIIDVIDVDRARLLVQQRFDWYFISALPGGRVAIYHEQSDGTPVVRIAALALR